MQENARNISAIKQRILQFAEHEGISKYELYQKTGISNGVFSQKGGMSEENLMKFLSYYSNVSEKWILTGDGPMIKNGEQKPKETFEPANITYSDSFKFLISRIEELAIENNDLKRENQELKIKKTYEETYSLPIASEPESTLTRKNKS